MRNMFFNEGHTKLTEESKRSKRNDSRNPHNGENFTVSVESLEGFDATEYVFRGCP